MNKALFFEEVKRSLFGNKLTQDQVDGLEAIIDEWFVQGGGPRQQLAYVLATPYHEVGSAYKPIRENLNYTSVATIRKVWPSRFKSDASAQPFVRNPKALAIKVYGGRLGNTASPSEDGWVYRGGGWAQVTGKENYAKFGLAANPDGILQPKVSAYALVKGMIDGMYTGKKLSDYITNSKTDYVNARRIINADVKANGEKIAGYAKKFDKALEVSGYTGKAPKPASKPIVLEPIQNEPKKNTGKNVTIASLIVGAIIAIGTWLKSIGIIP
jgi:putative chitinase